MHILAALAITLARSMWADNAKGNPVDRKHFSALPFWIVRFSTFASAGLFLVRTNKNSKSCRTHSHVVAVLEAVGLNQHQSLHHVHHVVRAQDPWARDDGRPGRAGQHHGGDRQGIRHRLGGAGRAGGAPTRWTQPSTASTCRAPRCWWTGWTPTRRTVARARTMAPSTSPIVRRLRVRIRARSHRGVDLTHHLSLRLSQSFSI